MSQYTDTQEAPSQKRFTLPQKMSAHLHHSREYHGFHANFACKAGQPNKQTNKQTKAVQT